MNQTIVQTIVENKCWIVTNQGHKIGTVMSVDEVDGGVVYVHDNKRERFGSIASLMSKYNYNFKKVGSAPAPTTQEPALFGVPCDVTPHNGVMDARRKLPLFTKTPTSKSYHAAGHYAVKYNSTWVLVFCPKFLSLKRHEFMGPFMSQAHADAARPAQGQNK